MIKPNEQLDMEFIKIAHQPTSISIPVLRNPRRKYLVIEISAGKVVVKAPSGMPIKEIRSYVFDHQDKIREHADNTPPPMADFVFEQGAPLLLHGTTYHLDLQVNSQGKIELDTNAKLIHLPIAQARLNDQQYIKNKVIQWYKQQASQRLEQRVQHYIQQMQLTNPNIKIQQIRDFKRRWGSCDQHGRIKFNWRLIMAPDEALNYVVVHELAHTIEHNHSARFWAIVKKTMPDWKRQSRWFTSNVEHLFRF